MTIPRYIRPAGMSLKDEIDLLYMIGASLAGICAKLDDDGGVTDENYEALCVTALINAGIKDSRGNKATYFSNADDFVLIGPHSISDKARCEALYQFFNMLKTLTAKLDDDGTVNSTTYEALCYTAKLLWRVRNSKGSIIGNSYYLFGPGGVGDQKELVDCYYAIVSAIQLLCEMLDDDTGVTDENYEALWYTANILIKVTNSAGSTTGNN